MGAVEGGMYGMALITPMLCRTSPCVVLALGGSDVNTSPLLLACSECCCASRGGRPNTLHCTWLQPHTHAWHNSGYTTFDEAVVAAVDVDFT